MKPEREENSHMNNKIGHKEYPKSSRHCMKILANKSISQPYTNIFQYKMQV